MLRLPWMGILLLAVVEGQQTTVDRVALPRHSLETPASSESLVDWEMAGGCVTTANSIVLSPAVPNSGGHLWNRLPILSDLFEVELSFEVRGPESSVSDGFSLWYVESPLAAEKVGSSDWNMFGFDSSFKGLGVFFANLDRAGKMNPSISAATNDGTKIWDVKTQTPSGDGVYWSLRNQKEKIIFSLAVSPEKISGKVRLASSHVWTETFTLKLGPGKSLASGGYLGLSAYTFNRDNHPGAVADMYTVDYIRSWNNDINQPGEEHAAPYKEQIAGVVQEHLIDGNVKLNNPHEIATAVQTMSRLLLKHVQEEGPRISHMQASLKDLSAELVSIANEVRRLNVALEDIASGKKSQEHLSSVHFELKGLKSLLSNSAQLQNSLHNQVNSLSGKLDRAPEDPNVRALEMTIKQQATFSYWLTLGLMVAVVGSAFAVWKRMRDMEKKHYL